MKKLVVFIVLLFVFGGFLSAQTLPKITIVNNTGYPINRLWFDPIGYNWSSWSLRCYDIDDENILETGESVDVIIPFPLSVVNTFDIFLYDVDGDAYIKDEVRITANARIVFTIGDLHW